MQTGWEGREGSPLAELKAAVGRQRKRSSLRKLELFRADPTDRAAEDLESRTFRCNIPPISKAAWGIVVNPPGTPMQLNHNDCGVCTMWCLRTLALTSAGESPKFQYNAWDLQETLRAVSAVELKRGRLTEVSECVEVSDRVDSSAQGQ